MCISVVRGIVVAAGCVIQVATASAGQAIAPVRIAAASIHVAPPPRMQDVTSVQRGRVTLDMNNVPLREVLDEIERQGDVTLLYSTAVVNVNRRVSISIRQATVADALAAALRGTGVISRVDGPGRVMLEGRAASDSTTTGTIRGRVVDAKSGEGVPQATIALRGSRYATLANEDGRYVIAKIEPGTYTLVARRIGYEPASESIVIAAGQDTDVTIRLRQSANILDKVIVTGTIVPTEVRAVPTPVTVISAEQIEQQDFRRLDQAVRMFVPSALAWQTGTAGEQNEISLRGASSLALGSPIKVYVDGMEVASSNFTMMDPSSVERVEIIRGPQAATIYGSDAIGGVMQVFTKKGNAALDQPEIDLKVSLGSVQSEYKRGGTLRQDYSAVVRGGTASAGYTIGGSFAHTADWIPYYYLSTPSAFGGVHIAQGKLALDLSGRFMTTKEPAASWPFLVKAGISSPLPPYEDQEYRQSTLGAHLTFDATTRWRHSLTLGVDGLSYDDHNTRPRFTTPSDSLMFVNVGDLRKMSAAYNTSFTLPVSASMSTVLTAGVDHYVYTSSEFHTFSALNNSGPINSLPDDPAQATRDVTTNTGVFGQAQVSIRDALFLTVGVRAEYNTNLGRDLGTPVSPRVGIAWTRQAGNATLKIRASYGQAIRAPLPQMTDYAKSTYYEILANPALGPERQRGFDAGLDVAFGRHGSFSVSYYDQTAIDLIQDVLVDANAVPHISQFQNVGRVANRGLELEGAFELGAAHVTAQVARSSSRVLALGPNYTGDLRAGDQILDIPHTTAGATVAISPFSHTNVTMGVAYVGALTNYDYSALYTGVVRNSLRDYWIRYPAFAKMNVSVSQTLSHSATAFVAVENLANSYAAEQFNISPLQGRTSMIGVRLHF